jgi:hypothetical protein
VKMTLRQISLARKTIQRASTLAATLALATAAIAPSSAGTPAKPSARNAIADSRMSQNERNRIAENYGKLSLSFETNQGQTDQRVQYISRGSEYTLFLTGDAAVLKLRGRAGKKDLPAAQTSFAANADAASNSSSVLHMRLLGANSAAKVVGLEEQTGKSNYFIGNNPQQWRRNVPNYSKVKYQDEYPGVDLVYYGNQRQLEYDFVVAPGADPHAIAMEIGADSLSPKARKNVPLTIAANGDLLVSTEDGRVSFHKPVAYQPGVSSESLAGSRTESSVSTTASSVDKDLVPAHWVVKNDNRVSFEIAAYDRKRPLVIDPALSFSTYLGGSLDDNTYSIATDASSNVYVTGTTESTDFPTQGALQAVNNGSEDAFITKLNSTGTALVYSTYLGGSATDFAFSLALNSSGDVYVVGTTQSADFPTTSGAFETICASCGNGFPSAFVTELNTTGSALVYSTFLGGTGDARGYGITLDSSNNAYVTGRTSSTDFPTTTGAFQRNLNGPQNIFVSKLNTVGSALAYSTFIGGNGSDQANGIAVDASGNAYVGGSSTSTNFPTTAGAFQSTLRGTSNAVVTKLNNKGTALVYSTYLGGSVADTVWGIRVDATNDVYVAGQTTSSNFPTTTGAFQTICGGGCASPDAFVTKFSSTGSPLYSTFLGGSGEEEGFALAIDSSGDAYVTGRTNSTDFPITHGSFETAFGGVFDAYVSELNPTGSGLLYSTFFGGNSSDAGLGIAVDSAKNIYLTGRTYSTNFPTTPLAFAPSCSSCSATGYEDAFIAKFIAGDQVWPVILDFGSQQLSVTSAPQTAVLSNSGTTTLGITGFSLGGVDAKDFAETNNCGSSLAAGATCKISVTFTPTTTGTRAATVTIADSASNNPQQISLVGSGTNNSVTLNPTTLTFTTQLVGTSSTAQNAILTNAGTSTVTIGSIVATGQFTQTNNCGSSLAAAASCTISVIFTPTAQGTDKGAVKITDNAAGSPQMLTLVGAATVVSVTPSAVNFGDQTVGTTSVAQTVTVTNHGAATLTIKKLAITGTGATNFAETTTCGTSLAAGANCTVTITFTPKSKSTFTAALSVADTGGGSPQSATLSGTGD